MRGKAVEAVATTQSLLNYMTVVDGKEESKRLLASLYDIKNFLEQRDIQEDTVFRGCREENDLYSEYVSGELWYWISNGFIEENPESDVYSYTEKGRRYFMSPSAIDERVNWNLSEKTKGILKQAIDTVIASRERE